MRYPALFGSLFTLIFFLSFITCMKTPSNPSENPMNVSVTLFYPDEDNTVKAGVAKQLGLEVVLPQHISGIYLSSSCGDVDTVIAPSAENQTDTMYLPLVFDNEGTCTLTVTAELLDERINEKTDKLVLHVLPGIPTLTFSVTPIAFTTHTGISDTLRFVTGRSPVDDIDFEVRSNPNLDSSEMFLIEPVAEDTVPVYFDPSEAGTYTVTLTATADTLTATASVTVTVLSSFTPSETDNPRTLITGITDTLIYSLTEEQLANGISMELLDAENLPDVATVIPSGSDSLLIAVIPGEEGTLSFSVATTNGELTDTTQYTFTFVNATDVVWNGTSVSADATEGVEKTVDLTHYFFTGVTLDDITLGAETGSIDNSGTWHYTPSWGSETTLNVTIIAKRGENLDQDLTISLTVAPGDDTDPVITLLSPSTELKTVGSSQTTVSVNATDAGAGVDHVTFVTSDTTINGTKENDSTFSAVISGLIEDAATDVIITATDGSMKKNSSTKTVSLAYDPAMEDSDAPVFSHVDGPQSGDRVTTATGSIIYGITDDNGVDSVWWTLNDEFVSAISASGDGEYTISYKLSVFGDNTVRLYAKDGASGANEGSRTITLDYNTQVTAVAVSGPQDGATDVSLTPSFTWTGGTDADGDSVFYRVVYGTSATDLSQETAILESNVVTLDAGQQLSPKAMYYWQVIGWSKTYPDTVMSNVVSFTTLDPTAEDHTGPQIARTAGPKNGDRVTVATGTIAVSVTDGNGVASVTVSCNGSAAEALSAGMDGIYLYEYTLPNYGENSIAFTAVDGSANSNESEEAITINYNTEPTAITLTAPADHATDVPVSPAFAWSGGDDADGDGVTFTLNYGTSENNLTGSASVSGKTATVSGGLDYNTTYFWRVTGTSTSADYNDEVQSDVFEFHTEGSLPVISTHPQSQTIEEGQSVTFSMTAAGFGTLSYQWRETGTDIGGATGNSYSISSVTTDMNGNTYDCVVSNEVGDITSNSATLTVTAIPTYTVTFDLQGGSPAVQAVDVTRGDLVTIPATPSRSGYTLRGWFKDSNGNEQWDFLNDIVTEPVTIYAVWEPINYSITYNLYGGQNGSNPMTYSIESAITLNDATRSAYVFKGWYTENSGGVLVTNIPQGSTGAVVLHARWAIEDHDGNTYTEVTIGTQVWMVENLRTTHYNDGTAIPHVEDGTEWAALNTAGYCFYENDESTYGDTYGALYNWYAVSSENIAPDGWHVATDGEWTSLGNYLEVNGYGNPYNTDIAKSMAAQISWNFSDIAGAIGNDLSENNIIGFTALPGGYRNYYDGTYNEILRQGYWWTASEQSGSYAWNRSLMYDSPSLYFLPEDKKSGYSVRCIRDF